MGPYDYTIQQPRIDLLGTALQMQNLMDARQKSAMNKSAMQDKERMLNEGQKFKSVLAQSYKMSGGDLDKAQDIAINQFPEYANEYLEVFGKLKDAQYKRKMAPLELKEKELGLYKTTSDIGSAKQDALSSYGAPMAKRFLSLPEGERLDRFRAFSEGWKNAGLDVPGEWVDQGYTPETAQQLEQISAMKETPKALSLEDRIFLKDYEYANKPQTQGRPSLVPNADGVMEPVDVNTGLSLWTGQPVKRLPPVPQYVTAGEGVYQKTPGGLVPAKNPQGEDIKSEKPMSGDAAKVLEIAESLPGEAQQLIDLYRKNPKKTLAEIMGGYGIAGRLAVQVSDKTGRLRSGGAINKDETKNFIGLLASPLDFISGPEPAIMALQSLIKEASGIANSMRKPGTQPKTTTQVKPTLTKEQARAKYKY